MGLVKKVVKAKVVWEEDLQEHLQLQLHIAIQHMMNSKQL